MKRGKRILFCVFLLKRKTVKQKQSKQPIAIVTVKKKTQHCKKAKEQNYFVFSPGRLNLELLKDFRIEEWEHHHLFQSVNVTTQSANLVKFHLEENRIQQTLQQIIPL